MIGAVTGGLASVAGGGKFANGAVTGAFGYLFNEIAGCVERNYCLGYPNGAPVIDPITNEPYNMPRDGLDMQANIRSGQALSSLNEGASLDMAAANAIVFGLWFPQGGPIVLHQQ